MVQGKWYVDSVSGSSPDGYDVQQILTSCSDCGINSTSVCTTKECGYLCYHMYKCSSSCYDFNNRHICKHIHRVHSLANSISASSTGADGANNLQSTPLENITDDFDTLSYADSVYIPQTGTHTCV